MYILDLFKAQEEKFNKIIDYFDKNLNAEFNKIQNEFKYYERKFINAEYRYKIIEIVKKIYNKNNNLSDLKKLIDDYDNGMLDLKNNLLDNLKNSTYNKAIENNNEKIFNIWADVLYPDIDVEQLSEEQRNDILNKINDPEKVILLLARFYNDPKYKADCLKIYLLNARNEYYEELIRIEDNILHQIYFEIDKTPAENINLQIFIEILKESLNAYKELQNNQEIRLSYRTHGIQKNRNIPYEIPEAKFFHLVGLPNCDFNGDDSNILGEFVKNYYELLKNNPNFIYNADIANVEILSQLLNDYGVELLSAIYNDMNIWFDNGDTYSNDNTKLILSKNDPRIDPNGAIEPNPVLEKFLINLLVDENDNKVIVNGATIEDIQRAWKQKRDEFINLYAPKTMTKGHQSLGKSLEKCIRYRHISQFRNLEKIVLDYSTPISKGWGANFISFTEAFTPKAPEKFLYFDFSFITPLDPNEKRLFIEETIKQKNGEKKILIPTFNPMYRKFIKKIYEEFKCKTFDDLYSLSVITPKDSTNNMLFDENGNPNFDGKIDISFVLELCKKFNYRTFDDLSAFPIVICESDKNSADINFKQVYSAHYGAVAFSDLMSNPNNYKLFVKFFDDDKKTKEILNSKKLSKLLAEYFAICVINLARNGKYDSDLFRLLDDKLWRFSKYFLECYNKKLADLRSGKTQRLIDYYPLGYKYVDPLLLKELLGSQLPIIFNSEEKYRYSPKHNSIRSDLPVSTILLDYDKKDLSKKISEEQKYAFRAFLLLAYTIAREVMEKNIVERFNQEKAFLINEGLKSRLKEIKEQLNAMPEGEKNKEIKKINGQIAKEINGVFETYKDDFIEIMRDQILSEIKDRFVSDNLPEPFKNIIETLNKDNLTKIDFLEFEEMTINSGINIIDEKAPRYISYESLYEIIKLFICLEIELKSNDLDEISKSIRGNNGKNKTHLFSSNNSIIERIRETLLFDDLRLIGKDFVELYVYNNLTEIRDNLPISLLIPISRMLQEADSKMESKSFEDEVAAFCYSEDVPITDDYGMNTKESYELYVKSFMNKNFTQMLYDINTNGYSYDIDSISYMSGRSIIISRLHNIFDKNKEYNLDYDMKMFQRTGESFDNILFSDSIHESAFNIIYDKISQKIPSDIQPEFYEYFRCVYDLRIKYSDSKYEEYENSLSKLEQKISNDTYLIEILDECSKLFYRYMNDLYDYENISDFKYLTGESTEQIEENVEFGDENINPDDNKGKKH